MSGHPRQRPSSSWKTPETRWRHQRHGQDGRAAARRMRGRTVLYGGISQRPLLPCAPSTLIAPISRGLAFAHSPPRPPSSLSPTERPWLIKPGSRTSSRTSAARPGRDKTHGAPVSNRRQGRATRRRQQERASGSTGYGLRRRGREHPPARREPCPALVLEPLSLGPAHTPWHRVHRVVPTEAPHRGRRPVRNWEGWGGARRLVAGSGFRRKESCALAIHEKQRNTGPARTFAAQWESQPQGQRSQ